MTETKPNFGGGYDGGGPRQAIPGTHQPPFTRQFDEVLQTLTQRRGKEYGHPYVDFARVGAIKAVTADCPDTRLRHVLDMIAVKMARLVHTPDHIDSWIDIAGYARTACMVLDRNEQKESLDET